jgi:hypothetical protein
MVAWISVVWEKRTPVSCRKGCRDDERISEEGKINQMLAVPRSICNQRLFPHSRQVAANFRGSDRPVRSTPILKALIPVDFVYAATECYRGDTEWLVYAGCIYMCGAAQWNDILDDGQKLVESYSGRLEVS